MNNDENVTFYSGAEATKKELKYLKHIAYYSLLHEYCLIPIRLTDIKIICYRSDSTFIVFSVGQNVYHFETTLDKYGTPDIAKSVVIKENTRYE